MVVELPILFQVVSLAIVAGGAYARIQQLDRELNEVKRDYKERVDSLRAEHSDYHDLKTDISVIKSKLESLDAILKHIYSTSIAQVTLKSTE